MLLTEIVWLIDGKAGILVREKEKKWKLSVILALRI